MKTLFKRKGLVAMLIFFVMLALSGAALAATGNLQNPLAALSMVAEGEHRQRDEGFEPPQRTENTSGERSAFGGGRGGGDENDSVNWSQFGQVLYNVWVLFAAAGVVMLIGLPLRPLRQRSRRQRTAPPTTLSAST